MMDTRLNREKLKVVWHHIRKGSVGYASLMGGVAAAMAYMYPHTIGLKAYREKMVTRTGMKPDRVDMDVLLLAEEIKQALGWEKKARFTGRILEFFPSSSIHYSHRGSQTTRWGGIVGVPSLYSVKSKKAENNDLLELSAGESDAGNHKLSRAAQKFALAREMSYTKSSQIYANSSSIGLAVVSSYVGSALLSQLLHFPGARLVSSLIVVPAIVLACILWLDWNNCAGERRADTNAASINAEFAMGGVEFYDSQIAREQLSESSITSDPLRNSTCHANFPYNVIEKIPLLQAWRKPELSHEERRTNLLYIINKLYKNSENVN